MPGETRVSGVARGHALAVYIVSLVGAFFAPHRIVFVSSRT